MESLPGVFERGRFGEDGCLLPVGIETDRLLPLEHDGEGQGRGIGRRIGLRIETQLIDGVRPVGRVEHDTDGFPLRRSDGKTFGPRAGFRTVDPCRGGIVDPVAARSGFERGIVEFDLLRRKKHGKKKGSGCCQNSVHRKIPLLFLFFYFR